MHNSIEGGVRVNEGMIHSEKGNQIFVINNIVKMAIYNGQLA
jgi:hypothetical protein